MDSTTPDPQPQPPQQQQQAQQQPQQPQQPQHVRSQQPQHQQSHQQQQQQQQAPPPPQQQPHPHQTQAQPQPQAGAYPPPPMNAYQHGAPYYTHPAHTRYSLPPQQFASPYGPFQAYTYAPAPQWTTQPAANYSPASAQPQLANMVHPQQTQSSNVPQQQQHNKVAPTNINPATIINQSTANAAGVASAANAAADHQRSHNQPGGGGVGIPPNVINVTNQQAAAATLSAARSRERKPAILKDPTTNKEVPLPNTASSITKSSATTSINSNNKPILSNASTATSTTTSNVEHVHKLLQKVSEDNNTDGAKKKEQQKQADVKGVDSKTLATTSDKKEEVGKDKGKREEESTKSGSKKEEVKDLKNLSETSKHEPGQYNPNSNNNKPILSNALTATNNTTTSKVEHVHTLLQKVSEDNNNDGTKKKKEQQQVVGEISDDSKTTTTTESTTINKKEEGEVEDKQEEDKDKAGDEVEEVAKSKEDEEEELINLLATLTYEPGQYNPISNRTGKKIYSKQFLIDICEKIIKQDSLPKESDDKDGIEGNQLQSAFSERIDMFAPSFSSSSHRGPANRQNEASRRQSQHNYTGRSSAGQERQRKVITSVSLTQEVELKTTSNPWRPTKDVTTKEDPAASSDDNEVETELLKKKFRSILNKLTPNNFESLAKAVTDLNIDTESKLGEVIDIVFAKALSEPGYCVLYGQMCSHLKKITAGTANFGNTLLKRCQHQFQSDIYAGINMKERKEKIEAEEDTEAKKQLNEELYDDMYRCRMRGLGLIKFIGELYKIEMLNDAIMLDCVLRLLSDTSEESLECLCDLLATIGEKLDRSTSQKREADLKEKKAPKSASKANAYQGGQKSAAAIVAGGAQKAAAAAAAEQQQTTIKSLDQVFEQLHKIRKNKELDLSVRIRFKLLDTCELREKDNWSSKKTKDNNPKKIEEIHQAHKEKLEQERRQQTIGPRRSQEGRRGLGHSGGSSSQISSLAIDQGGAGGGGGGNRGSAMHTSSSSHLLRNHSIGDEKMKSNFDDIESQKEHQRKIENFKGILLKNQQPSNQTPASTTSSSSDQPPTVIREALRPNSQIYTRKKV